MSNWTTQNIPSQSGKTFLVTGANSGLGFGTTKELARKGAHVVMTSRNMAKGEKAMADIKREIPHVNLELMQLDLADLDSVSRFSHEFKEKHDKLDVLINNAGVMMLDKRTETKQGFEMQIGTNHFGHFALTGLLLPLIESTAQSRVVTISSIYGKVKQSKIYWDDIHWKKNYDKTAAYCQSKFANLLFTLELEEKLKANNSNSLSLAAHPGYTATNLQQHLGLMGKIMNFTIAQKLEMGILPTLRAATDPNVKGGEFYGPAKFNELRGYPILSKLPNTAFNKGEREKFWKLSEKLTRIHFN